MGIDMTISVKPSSIAGFGVFANVPFAAGETIHVMSGKNISFVGAGIRVIRGQLTIDNPLNIGKYRYRLLDDPSVRFNHNCDPNAGLRKEAEMFAYRDIAAGEEITFDYSLTVLPTPFTARWRMPCGCGAPSCRGTVTDIRGVPSERIAELQRRGALQDFVLAWLERGSASHAARQSAQVGVP